MRVQARSTGDERTLRGGLTREREILFHHLAMPHLQHQQVPELKPMIRPPLDMLADQPANRFRLEVTALRRPPRQQRVFEKLSQRAAKPDSDLHDESTLGTR